LLSPANVNGLWTLNRAGVIRLSRGSHRGRTNLANRRCAGRVETLLRGDLGAIIAASRIRRNHDFKSVLGGNDGLRLLPGRGREDRRKNEKRVKRAYHRD